MNAIIEKSWSTIVNPGETAVECINPWIDSRDIETNIYDHCCQCGCLPYKVLIVQNKDGKQRGIQLCGRHFIEVCKLCDCRESCKLALGYADKAHRSA